jgi:purine-cytosine permease-like protein
MLTSASAVDAFKQVRPTIRTRVVGIVAIELIVLIVTIELIVALSLPSDYLASFNNFLLLMLYFLVPWTAVNLVDFYAVRRGHYDVQAIFDPDGEYGRWSPAGLTSYVVGILAMVPFMALSFYTGPVAKALGGADISFAVGLLVAGGLYYFLTGSVRRRLALAT